MASRSLGRGASKPLVLLARLRLWTTFSTGGLMISRGRVADFCEPETKDAARHGGRSLGRRAMRCSCILRTPVRASRVSMSCFGRRYSIETSSHLARSPVRSIWRRGAPRSKKAPTRGANPPWHSQRPACWVMARPGCAREHNPIVSEHPVMWSNIQRRSGGLHLDCLLWLARLGLPGQRHLEHAFGLLRRVPRRPDTLLRAGVPSMPPCPPEPCPCSSVLPRGKVKSG